MNFLIKDRNRSISGFRPVCDPLTGASVSCSVTSAMGIRPPLTGVLGAGVPDLLPFTGLRSRPDVIRL